MKTLPKIFLVCCLCAAFNQFLQAASPSGYVIEWGWDTADGKVAPGKQVLSDAVSISAGRLHCLALKNDGTVIQWGGNFRGEANFNNSVLTTGESGSGNMVEMKNTTRIVTNGAIKINGQILSNVTSVVSAAAGSPFGLALKEDGTVVAWGENYVPKELTNIVAIAADEAHSWVLKRDGTVVGWWRENSRSYGLLTAENVSNAVAIAVGSAPQGRTRGIALRSDSTVMNWGAETTYQDASPPRGLSNVIAVAAAYNHTLALKRDGTVVGWGFNKLGQATGVPTTNSPYVSAGGVTLDGQTLGNVVSIAAGQEYSMALKRDGTVVMWGRMVNGFYPATVPEGLSNVVAIAAGDKFCLAITTNAAAAERFRQKSN
jgi:alpha-tubulin suppressor-like RCC1 family protein